MVTVAQKPLLQQAQRHISVSQLKTFSSMCSLQWLYSRLFKPAFISSSLKFGSAFHVLLANDLQARLEGRTLTRDELLAAYDSGWTAEDKDIPVKFGKGETMAGLRATAAAMLDAYVAHVASGPQAEILAVEQRFDCELAPSIPILTGYIDLISIEDNALVVTDFKTAAKKPAANGDGVDPAQLLTYGMSLAKIGYLREYSRLPLKLRYRYIIKSAKKPMIIDVPITPTRQDADTLVRRAALISKAMEMELCWPTRGWWCVAGCGYQSRCQRWGSEDIIAKGGQRP